MIDVSIDKSFFLCERVVVVFIILQSFPGSVKARFASVCVRFIDIELLNEKCLPCEVRKRNDRPSAVIFAGFPRMGKMTL